MRHIASIYPLCYSRRNNIECLGRRKQQKCRACICPDVHLPSVIWPGSVSAALSVEGMASKSSRSFSLFSLFTASARRFDGLDFSSSSPYSELCGWSQNPDQASSSWKHCGQNSSHQRSRCCSDETVDFNQPVVTAAAAAAAAAAEEEEMNQACRVAHPL